MRKLVLWSIVGVLAMITLFTTCGYERIDAGHAGIQVELFGNDKGVQGVALINGGSFTTSGQRKFTSFQPLCNTKCGQQQWMKATRLMKNLP